MLYVGQSIIVPLIYATIFAILLNRVVNFLHRYKLNRVLAIVITIILTMTFFGMLVFFIASQMSMFSEAFPELKEKFNELLSMIVSWVSSEFNISTSNIDSWIKQTKQDAVENSNLLIGKTLTTVSGLLIVILLLPVYIFMLLFYKPLLLEFIKKLFHRTEHGTVAEVLVESKTVIQSYLIGLLIETAIVAALNAIGLLILGVDYAILLGFIGALLNIIPYVGGLIALSLAVVMALVTKPPTYALLVMAMFLLIQLIDNNFLVPKIVASKVRLNALVSLIAVLCGGALWGIPGMFLSIPLLAIIKVIFDRIEPLKPWGFVLGDTMPPIGKIIFRFPVVGALKKVK